MTTCSPAIDHVADHSSPVDDHGSLVEDHVADHGCPVDDHVSDKVEDRVSTRITYPAKDHGSPVLTSRLVSSAPPRLDSPTE